MIATSRNSALEPVAAKVEAGKRLSQDDGVALYQSRDIHELGRLANLVRERLHGDAAYYNVNRHINYSNVCVLRCKFCSFYRPYPTGDRRPTEGQGVNGGLSLPLAGEAPTVDSPTVDSPTVDSYELSVETIAERAKQAYDGGATEVHIVGGLHPKLPFSYYTDMCRAIRELCPRMHIKAFTAIEIIHFTRITRPRLPIREVLVQLRDAGLGSLPGGGAEIFDDRVHDEAYQNKVGEQGWFDVHRTAHELGIFTNATMLYGHVERPEERIGHMIKLREHQDESLRARAAAFNCFIPLSFVPDGSALADRPGPTGLDDLKTLAISRLMLDNVPHIKAFWIMQSAKLAQVSLNWGVDDVDGTVVYYDITKREGGSGNTHQELSVDMIRRLIVEAGRRPIERDTLYRRVERQGASWRVEGRCDPENPENPASPRDS
ncbi:MAG: CofH family radical SAM protein [Planctomycetota bacterium]|nr:CofH family radical SAM protein [Planctomycetota bacterium]